MQLLRTILCVAGIAAAASYHVPKSVPRRISSRQGGHSSNKSPASSSSSRMQRRELNGVTYSVFEHRDTNSSLSLVEDSGICETTPGVKTYSGYLSVGTNMSMFFWFFEARNNASTAPLALWLNGGPGCSSMIGLFQEHGPCRFVNGSTEPTLNPYSWNTYANMLYVDQPIGTGFSFGDDQATSTVTAAPFVWRFLQAFLDAFPTYESRDFGLWTESYGGHYGPEFADYFQAQNAAISNGTITGDPIDLIALGVNNGWIDPVIQYQSYVDYGYNNSHRQLINDSQYATLNSNYDELCLPLLELCPNETGDDEACLNADSSCYEYVEGVVETGLPDYPDFDVYDIREPSDDPFPPETYVDYLQRPDIMKAIGAQVTYAECPDDPYYLIADTGDDARSFLGSLSKVVQSGINILIWAGDADWICNHVGVERAVNEVEYNASAEFKAAALSQYTINGTSYGEYKVAGNLNYFKVFEAGHEVAYYQPEVALQAFWQIMRKQPLQPTS